MAKVLEYNAVVSKRIDLEPTLSIFSVRPFATASCAWFVPGQYTTLGLNGLEVSERDARDRSVRRPMSIASAPEILDELEFYLRYVEEPQSKLPLTHLMWSKTPGDELYCRTTAAGKFTIEHTVGLADRRLKLLIAAGTGLAPFLCMARSRILKSPDARLDDIAILHGASYPSGLGYREELLSMVRDHGLKYLATVSRPDESPSWAGATGRVETLLEPDRIEDTERMLELPAGTLHPAGAVAYVCGLQGTLRNAMVHLMSRGYVPNDRRLRRALQIAPDTPSSLFFEQYDSAPLIDPTDHALLASLASCRAP